MDSSPNCFKAGPGRHRRVRRIAASALAASALRRPARRRPCRRELLLAEKSGASPPPPNKKVCAGQALTFNEPDGARPKLAGQNFCVILPEGLHKKTGSSTLSGARVAQEASEGRPLKLGCATTRRARLLGKCIWGLKFLDRPPLPKTYSKGTQNHPKLGFHRIC